MFAVFWLSALCFFQALSTKAMTSSPVCRVRIVSREEWGGRPPKAMAYMDSPASHIFIHHTATASCSNSSECTHIMRSIQNYHMDDRGWDDIGYNFLIGGDGNAYVGRGWDRVGAHTLHFNRNSIALSLIGNFVSELPPTRILDAATEMIECAFNNDHVMEDFKIHGHRDAGSTDCPGNALYDIIKDWDRFQPGPLPH